MAPTLQQLLERAAGDADRDLDMPALLRRAERRRRQRARRRAGLVVVAVIVVALVGSIVPMGRDDSRDGSDLATIDDTTTRETPIESTASEQLLVDDGYDGIVAIDPIARIVVRAPVKGQRAGDQPHRLLLVGYTLVVGRGELFAAPATGGQSRKIGNATIAIPAEQPNRIWLVDYPGAIGDGQPSLRLADVEGRIEVEVLGLAPEDGHPVAGALGGIVHETDNGLVVWDPATRRITRTLGSSSARVLAASHGAVAWCEALCDTLHLTRVGQGDAVFGGFGHLYSNAQFSPDGRRLVVVRGPDPDCCRSDRSAANDLAVIDAIGGTTVTGFRSAAPVDALSWSPAGDAIVVATSGPGAATTFTRFSITEGETGSVTVPITNVQRFVMIASSRAPFIADARDAAPEQCPAASGAAPPREKGCWFGFP
jgi:hypothetical protein